MTMIVWKMHEVMSKQRMKNRELANRMGVDENTVYRLRKTDSMPRLTGDRLNSLCKALNCLPADLLVFIPDEDESDRP